MKTEEEEEERGGKLTSYNNNNNNYNSAVWVKYTQNYKNVSIHAA